MLKPDTASGPTLAMTTAKLVRNQSSSRSFIIFSFVFVQSVTNGKWHTLQRIRWVTRCGGVVWRGHELFPAICAN